MKRLKQHGIEVIIHESALKEESFFNSKVVNDLESFKSMSHVIFSNRLSGELIDIKEKIYTRDLFNAD